ncbi:hypothetical protein M4R22_06865 [Acidovorax sp. GBBC 3334]|uniref:hypothetical protein n=1 Tax=unclassified Acidovorax TaxID=2684926 RepID=UPI002303D732|nr:MULTISPECIES: hypothetical protein [unclassified Acidovorax]MDA8454476.1 hypothetical protein [Acidovorax sp. GBBC 3334]MDA8519586.1 hypothetical protein [Acidovorax sp. NCPPB 4044]
MATASTPSARQGELREALPRIENLLRSNRAGEIGEDVIDELVRCAWMEWNGGALRMTATGQNICRQMQTR